MSGELEVFPAMYRRAAGTTALVETPDGARTIDLSAAHLWLSEE
jgi:hypothetical protein